jgi:hypothetical protein
MPKNNTGENVVPLVRSFEFLTYRQEQLKHRHTLLEVALAFERGGQQPDDFAHLCEAGGKAAGSVQSQDSKTIFRFFNVAEPRLDDFSEALEQTNHLLAAAITTKRFNVCFPEGIVNGDSPYFELPDTKTERGWPEVIYQNPYEIVHAECPGTQLANLSAYFDAELFAVDDILPKFPNNNNELT